ncbi:sensor histidine kinase [Xiamenia xianingshaonis]|uniref:Oxygen sensor histidine kinase NreB n=1 Tax=Xiamenia xianingshaonis TaxID=2682776 RepID=A0A9E6SU80_9ACTN|nr:ATP-binding protein [Xiamenia xianingshaonis]NHM14229.1 hypothetical protein [Xiamenia xianingshaonis]QTU84159.1 hypothetical protein J7S26_07350 [Xiamenia xianingshaonis]
MSILEEETAKFCNLLESIRSDARAQATVLYREMRSGALVPICFASPMPDAVPPLVAGASDVAETIRAHGDEVFEISKDAFKDHLVRSGLDSFGVTALAACRVPDVACRRYFLTACYADDDGPIDGDLLKSRAAELGAVHRNAVLRAQGRIDDSFCALFDEINAARCAFSIPLMDEILNGGTFSTITKLLHEKLGGAVLIEDANGLVVAATSDAGTLPAANTWLRSPSRLPFLDLFDAGKDLVPVPADYCDDCRHRLIMPLVDNGILIGAISVNAVPSTADECRLLLASRFAALYLLRCKEAARSTILKASLNSVENEQARVALELHNDASQNLVALKVALSTTSRLMEIGEWEHCRGAIDDCQRIADEALGEINRLSAELRPHELNYLGLKSAIDAVAQARLARVGIAHAFSGNALGIRLGALQESMLLIGATEALTNCAKHSHATAVDIFINYANEWLTLGIRDNGDGFESGARGRDGLGLKAMSDCAEAIGGNFWIGSVIGKGTTVRFNIPSRALQEV